MNAQIPALNRRNPNPTRSDRGNGSNGHAQNGHPRKHLSLRKSISSKVLAVSILSFLLGVAFTNPAARKAEEHGFEPPRVRARVREPPGDTTAPRTYHNDDADSSKMQQPKPQNQKRNNPHPRDIKPTPRLIGLQINQSPAAVLTYKISSALAAFSLDSEPEGHPVQPSWYESNAARFMDGHDFEKCVPMAEWQLESFVDCNKFHELDLSRMRMINKGGSRIAFEMTQSLPLSSPHKFVYKTMKYSSEIDIYLIEQQRKDSLVMERTTSSKFIPAIHGYCSLAVMMDFMPEGNMHDYIKGSRILSRKLNGAHGVEDKSGKLLKPVDRLKVAIHIATSVADLHGIDGTTKPSYFHNDICCHQYLFQDGLFKLNDFNYARPIYMDKKTHQQCTRSSYGMVHWKGRSLEEHIKHLGMPFDPPVPDKIDVWMMGDVMYYILTDLYTFEKPENLNNYQAGKLLLEGKRSPYPSYIERSTDPAHVAVKKALDMAWVQNWRERPSARRISEYMMGELRKITGEEEPDLRVVLPEREEGQSPSDGEYNVFND